MARYSWTSDGTSATADSICWEYWNYYEGNTASSTGSILPTWVYWTDGQNIYGNTVQAAEISQEERQRREADSQRAVEEHNRRQEQARLEKEAADIKALDLLQDILPEGDFAFYQKHGRLLVKGRKHDYLIQKDSGIVVRLEKGKVADLCMHLEDHHAYSRHDNVIAMKLYLEGREEEFNREANLHRRREPVGIEQELLSAVG